MTKCRHCTSTLREFDVGGKQALTLCPKCDVECLEQVLKHRAT
jgi:hypothetical protein